MNRLIRIVVIGTAMMLVAACGSTAAGAPPAAQGSNPYAPQAGDGNLLRGDLRVVSADIRLAESNPPQAMLGFDYFQPTPCFKLRVEPQSPDAQNRINVSAYAVTEKDKACTLMALATPLHASLNLGSYPRGHYSVWLNGSKIGEFDS